MAVLSCALVLGLLVLAGPNLVYPAVMALAAVLVGVIVRRRGGGKRAGGDVDRLGAEVARDAA
jgi:hypothetical protein